MVSLFRTASPRLTRALGFIAAHLRNALSTLSAVLRHVTALASIGVRLLLLGLIVYGLLLFLRHAAVAQTTRVPDQADIERALAAARAAAAASQAPAAPVVPPRALDPKLQPAPDLSELARDYDRIRGQRGATAQQQPDPSDRQIQGLLIFASLGMPKASLDRLVKDAEKTRSVLVLRGVLDGSLQKTKARIRELAGDAQVAWQIDPTLFDRFRVTGVPTFVLIDPSRPVAGECGSTLCQQASFSKVAGDVTTAFALADIARRDPDFGAVARRYALPLGGLK